VPSHPVRSHNAHNAPQLILLGQDPLSITISMTSSSSETQKLQRAITCCPCIECKRNLPLSDFSKSQNKAARNTRKCLTCSLPFTPRDATGQCCVCSNVLPLGEFSATQRKRKREDRKCPTCVLIKAILPPSVIEPGTSNTHNEGLCARCIIEL